MSRAASIRAAVFAGLQISIAEAHVAELDSTELLHSFDVNYDVLMRPILVYASASVAYMQQVTVP